MSARGVWFARTGVEGGPQMVMVHGSLDRSTGLSRLTRRFDDRYDILRFDRRGYGKSGEHEVRSPLRQMLMTLSISSSRNFRPARLCS